MKLIGLMCVRNEDWILRLSARAALAWCDELVVIDHESTDGTPGILANLERVTVERVTGSTWAEMSHRQRSLDLARKRGATHCAIVDADEVLTGNLVPWIREQIRNLESCTCLTLPMVPVWRSLWQRRADPCVWTRGIVSLAFRLEEHLAWRPQGDGYEHHHREPYGIKSHKQPAVDGGVMHLQWASWRRVVAKHALYKVVERVRWPKKYTDADLDRIYGQALDETGARLDQVPREWWDPYSEHMWHAHLDSVPWQEDEARRLYSPATMSGLNLFGVVK